VRLGILRLLLGAAAALAVAASVHSATSAARPGRLIIERAATLPRGDQPLGALAAADPVRGAVVLKSRDEGALTRFIARVSDPHSAGYRHFLHRGGFAARFGPTATAGTAIAAALRRQGLHVGATRGGGLIVPFSGSTADAERAFATTLHAVALPGGATGHATTAPVSLPASVAGSVAAVIGLDDTVAAHRIATPSGAGARPAHTPAATAPAAVTSPPGAPHACPAATAAARRNGGLTDDEIAGAYGATGLYGAGDTGAGQRIAVYELEPFLLSDIKTFDTCYFGAQRAAAMIRRLHVFNVDGGPPHGTGSGEASLDVEDISALAPGAQIDVYVGPAPTSFDSLDEYAAIADADRDHVVSTSWGLCEQGVEKGQPGFLEAENLIFQQAAAQGQTVFSAAGDNGSDDCNVNETPTPVVGQNPVSVDDPASQPYVVGVGGTTIDDAAPSNPLEHVWNDGAAFGAGGGGISAAWAMPSWQQASRVRGIARPGGAVYRAANQVEFLTGYPTNFCHAHVRGLAPSTPCRLVPDVSAEADEFTGGITVYSRSNVTKKRHTGWSTVGGTSSAAPIWAASLALVHASPACRGRDVGFVSPSLYSLASDPATDALSFTDVRAGNNDVYGLNNGKVFLAGRGYDPVTGLGSPRLSGADGSTGLATELCDAGRSAAAPVVTGLRPSRGSATGGERIVIRGHGFRANGHSRVTSVQIGTASVPATKLRVTAAAVTLRLPPARRTIPPGSTAAQNGSGPADVVVTLRDGTSSALGPRAVFDYVTLRARTALPTVSAISPAGGPIHGGRPVTVLGTGFAHVREVTFGGVRAPFRVASPDRIVVTPPARTARVHCAPLPHRGFYVHDTAGNDVCQVQVRVRNARGLSAPSRIRPPLEGPEVENAQGDLLRPPGCGCEVAEATDEFDYVPRPHISSVTTHAGPLSLASEHGGTVITVHGRGLTPFGLDFADFGDPRRFSSEAVNYTFVTGTKLQIHAPKQKLSAGRLPMPFSVRSLGGRSNSRTVLYAGVPRITSVVNVENGRNLKGVYGAPDTGRTPLVVHGVGMKGQVFGVEFIGKGKHTRSFGSQYHFRARTNRVLTAQTVSQNPSIVAIKPCTVTGCPRFGPHNLVWLYPPGAPRVQTVSPASGPAAGGTAVTVGGANLGCALSVDFGSTTATFRAAKNLLFCGSTMSLRATTPPGAPGATVPVTVQTAEGFYTHSPPVSIAGFSYR
jgi:Pro-kumamolisin, activation domain/Subtilase family/IPT/TIG domain